MVQVIFHGRVEVRLCNDALALCFHDVCLEYLPSPDGKHVAPPALELFLTEKKAKARMVDVHTQGTRIPCSEQTMQRLCSTTPCQVSQSLKGSAVSLSPPPSLLLQLCFVMSSPMLCAGWRWGAQLRGTRCAGIVDIHAYKGFAMVKLPDTPPKTAEAVVFAYAPLNAPKVDVKPIESAMGMKEIRDQLSITRNSAMQDSRNATRPPPPPSPFIQQRAAAASSGGVPSQHSSAPSPIPTSDTTDLAKLPRAQVEYSKLAMRAWQMLGLAEEHPITFERQYQSQTVCAGLSRAVLTTPSNDGRI